MVNYQNSKIYKIESMEGDLIYIGSTSKEYLSQRMTHHRLTYKRWQDGKVNKVMVYDMFDKYGVENCSIVLLELFPRSSIDELRAREGHYIKSMECVNKYIAGRSQKQWVEDNKEHRANYLKNYAEEHREHLVEYKKKYTETNKEAILKKKREWREANKDIVNAKQQERRRLAKLQQQHST